MKIIANKYMFFGIAIACVSGIACGILITISTWSEGIDMTLIMLQLAFLGPLILLIFSREMQSLMSIITINGTGVNASFMRSKGILLWDEIAEVGIGTHNDRRFAYTWIYFSKRPLTEQEIVHMERIGNNDDAIRVRYSQKTLVAVRKYYQGRIKNLKNDIKGHFML